jgi:hypothetical protein
MVGAGGAGANGASTTRANWRFAARIESASASGDDRGAETSGGWTFEAQLEED